MKAAVCTIIAKNYLPHARVLMDSVRKHHPAFLRFVILADRVDGYFDPGQEDFVLISSTDVPLPQSKWFHFKYDVMELSTGLKPYALEMLFDQYELDQVIYLDPDIKIYSALDPVTEALTQSDIVLIPHLSEPIDDQRRPNELDILQAGSYNLGFIAVNSGENSRSFLRWWQKNVHDQCVVDPSQGLFVDQKWIDLVPGMFARVGILRDHPGLNLAYWNIHNRRLEGKEQDLRVNGKPLYFFHFSGFNPAVPEQFSKYQDRFRTSELGDGATLIRSYAQDLFEHGHLQCKGWPCAYDFFADGTPIPAITRAVLGQKAFLEQTVKDPFSAEGLRAYVEAWNESLRGPERTQCLTRLAYRIYQSRADLQAAMPDVFGAHWRRFVDWMLTSGKAEYRLPEILIAPLRELITNLERLDSTASSSAAGYGAEGAATVGTRREGTHNDRPGNGTYARPTPLSQYIYESRLDLRRAFPDPWGQDSLPYLNWLLSYGRWEYRLDAASWQPFIEEWRRLQSAAPTPLHSWWRRAKLAAYSASARLSSHRRSGSHHTANNRGLGLGVQAARMSARFAGETAATIQNRSKRLPALGADGRLGINAVGYLHAEMGVGEVVRATIRAAQAAGVDTAVKRITTDGAYREKDTRIQEDETHSCPVNVIHVNADHVPLVLPSLDADLLHGRYNIGYWCWEVEEFPERFCGSFACFDEIWTLSRFSQDAIARKSPIPVIRIPPAVEIPEVPVRDRAYFGLPNDAFLVLTAFDVSSVFERKNPLAAVRAFVEALGDDETSHLVLKVSNGQGNPVAMRSLLEACANRRVTILDKVIDRADVYALFQACDCLISLHRAEGFGLTIAEAMCLGKPVIATGYSGNMDFMTVTNSFLAGYQLVSVPANCDPYPTTAHWAEPSIADAVKHLKVVRNHPCKREEVARAGRADVRQLLSSEAVGRQIRNRLELLHGLAGQ